LRDAVQGARGIAEQGRRVVGLLVLDGGLQLLDDVFDSGLHGAIARPALLGLADGFQGTLMNDRHNLKSSGETSLIATMALAPKSRKPDAD
jgi:hypothetical protein